MRQIEFVEDDPVDADWIKQVKRKEPVRKFNPHHAPAGSSEGGQFTSGEAHSSVGMRERADGTQRSYSFVEGKDWQAHPLKTLPMADIDWPLAKAWGDAESFEELAQRAETILRQHFGELTAAPGEQLLYRIHGKEGTDLTNRNAANAAAIAQFVGHADEAGLGIGSQITAYSVKLPPTLGKYSELIGGHQRAGIPPLNKILKRDTDGTQERDERGRWTTGGGKPIDPLEQMNPYDLPDNAAGNAMAIYRLQRLHGVPKDAPVKEIVEKTLAVMPHALPRLSLVHELGKPIEVNGSDDIGTPHMCYNNSIERMVSSVADDNPAKYMEGVVIEQGVPLSHAWNMEKNEATGNEWRAVDHTIVNPHDHQYLGLHIPKKVIFEIASGDLFGSGAGEGVLGTLLKMKEGPAKRRMLQQIREANS